MYTILLWSFITDNSVSDNQTDVVSKFSALNGHRKIKFLLRISYKLTIVARDISTYKNEQLSLRAAVGMSEINHKILSYVLHAMDGEYEKTFPADELLLIVLDMMSGYGLDPCKQCILGS